MTPWKPAATHGLRSGSDWYDEIAEIMRHTDLPSLPAVLVEAIRRAVSFDHGVIFGYPERRRPVFLYDGFSSAQKRSAVAPYLNGTYLVDPFYEACVNAIEPGLYRMSDLAPDQFFTDVGQHPGYVSPCVSDEPGALSEEIGFFARNEHNAYLVLSLMRPHDAPPFSGAEYGWLQRIAPVVLAAMSHHWRELGVIRRDGASSNPALLADHVENVFDSFGAPVLSAREQEIARMILRGHSSESIGQRLGIAVATVKIHRRNIYAKLKISSQSELFALFIDRLAIPTRTVEAQDHGG